MSALRIGTDLVFVPDVAESLANFGERYSARVFTPAEIAYCQTSPTEAARRFAARFAAKEAAVKVLRPQHHWFDWRELEVVRTAGGWCEMRLHGKAEACRVAAGLRDLAVSMTHERDYALAVVTAVIPKPVPSLG